MTGERRWLLAATAWCAVAIAGPPSPPSPGPSPAQDEAQPQAVPDEELIEFLGADDVEDETWWEFLKKAPPRRESPHAALPQEAKQ